MKRCLLSLAVVAALSGCSLIPDYQRPEAPVPSAWETGDEATATDTALIGWQAFFKDPELQRLIGVALFSVPMCIRKWILTATAAVCACRQIWPTVTAA